MLDISFVVPIMIGVAVVVLVVIAAIVKGLKDNKNKSNGGSGSVSGNIGEYYRWQQDKQRVLIRTPQQKRIVDDYFIVKNVIEKNKVLPAIGIIACIFGVLLLTIGSAVGVTACLVIGGIALIIGLICVIVGTKMIKISPPKTLMTDEEYEKLVKERIEELNIQALGLERLGLDSDQVKEIKPIIFSGKVIEDTSLTVYNSDTNKIHSSTHYVTLLYFTDAQLFVYKIQFDMCCNEQDEWTSEFFYIDICDISSYINNNILAVGGHKGALIEYSSIDVSIVATNSKISFSLEGSEDRFMSIQAMKQKIREKKM